VTNFELYKLLYIA